MLKNSKTLFCLLLKLSFQYYCNYCCFLILYRLQNTLVNFVFSYIYLFLFSKFFCLNKKFIFHIFKYRYVIIFLYHKINKQLNLIIVLSKTFIKMFLQFFCFELFYVKTLAKHFFKNYTIPIRLGYLISSDNWFQLISKDSFKFSL